MVVRSITGDDAINEVLTSAMEATVTRLVNNGSLTKEVGKDFLDKHVCMIVNKDGGFLTWLKRRFNGGEVESLIVIAKVA